jgi:hypothetical protein
MSRVWYQELIKSNPNPKYGQLLTTYEWSIKRHEILNRDKHQCQECKHTSSSSELRVHHKKYTDGSLPWEYNNDMLITLCEECHAKEHDKENHPAKFRKGMSEYIKNGLGFGQESLKRELNKHEQSN